MKKFFTLFVLCLMLSTVIIGCGKKEPPKPNNAPVISSLIAEPKNVPAEKNSLITCMASDIDGDSLVFDWTASGGSVKSDGNKAEFIAPTMGGIYQITVKISDGRGSMIQKTVDVTVNSKPDVTLRSEQTEIETSSKLQIICEAKDSDNDSLTYSWSVSNGTIQDSGNIVTFIAPETIDTCVITVKVSDGKEEVNQSLSIITKATKKAAKGKTKKK